ncbi:dihydrolipoyllysine-residue acetyltransferase [Candidatus Njordibacter sp. Uisw_058]|uniref:dihydrolipoyllysine-residue acetyltransferase n=1 Tax=Candidatus Njordibacter sp. Uisw_058 TaxID=3230974 RepID=UPI003D4B1D00
MATSKMMVPDMGGAVDVEVIEICVAVGDVISEGDSIVVVETDKASMEIPASIAGVVKSIALKEGDTCSLGDLMVEIETDSTPDKGKEAEPQVLAQAEVQVKVEMAVEPLAAVIADAPVQAPVAESEHALEQLALVPDLGGAVDVEVIEVSVKVGDELAEGDSLIVLETDKASMEIPVEFAGTVLQINVAEGAKLNVGDAIAVLASTAEAVVPEVMVEVKAVSAASEALAPVPAVAQTPVAAPKAAQAPNVSVATNVIVAKVEPAAEVVNSGTTGTVHAGPAVRMLARELGVDLSKVPATGPRDRLLKEDIQAFVKQKMQQPAAQSMQGHGIEQPPAIDFSQYGSIDRIKMTKVQRITAQNMTRSWLNVPHVTQFDHADITDLELFRKGLKAEAELKGTKVTPLPFMLKACAMALRQYPQFNVSLDNDGEHIVQKHYINIGIAVDTPAGLMVPVIRDVDQKSIWQLAEEVIVMGAKAKDKKLMPADMQGGCFTISSLGGIGGTAFTPIVNTPEVAILGVSKADMQPRWDGSEFQPRLMMPLCLSYDHRAVNGADAARFTQYLAKVLGDIRHLVM